MADIKKLTLKEKLYQLRGMSLKDIINTYKWSRIGVELELHDPFLRPIVERQMEDRGIRYIKGFDPSDTAYTYALIKGSDDKISDFIKWFTSTDYRWGKAFNALFDKEILVLIKQ